MQISRTSTFKRNYKALKKKHYDMGKLEAVLKLIVNDDKETLVRKHKLHQLKGKHKGISELHIEEDWLLLFFIRDKRIELLLLATGKHDDVFRPTYDLS